MQHMNTFRFSMKRYSDVMKNSDLSNVLIHVAFP